MVARSITMRAPVADMDSRCTASQMISMELPQTAFCRRLASGWAQGVRLFNLVLRPTFSRVRRSSG